MNSRNLLLAGTLAVLACALPASAAATNGSYEVSACNYAPEAVNNSWTWATTDPSQPDHYAEHVNCPDRLGGDGGTTDQEGGLSTTDALGLSSGAPPSTSAGWTFSPPTGTTITGITYERYIGHESDPDNYWSPALRADGAIVPNETCLDSVQDGESCIVGGPPGEGDEPGRVTGLSAHQLSLGIECRAPTGEECITGAKLHGTWAAMYGATVTVNDPTPPTLSTPSGALWEPGEADDDAHKGTESVTVSARDVGGGVQSIVLAADGKPVASYDAQCNFTFAQPCPSSTGPQTLTLPTTELSDGTHTLTLLATDAADNQSTIASEQITVKNSETVACPAAGVAACGPLEVTPIEKVPSTANLGVGTSPSTSPSASPSGASGTPPAKAAIHLSETLRGRELVVRVSGPAAGTVRVGFIGRLAGRTVASGAKTLALKKGRLTVTFKLGPRTAALATIRVSAKLDQEQPVSSILRRPGSQSRRPGWRDALACSGGGLVAHAKPLPPRHDATGGVKCETRKWTKGLLS